MKIEEVIHVMADVSETLDLEGVHQAAAELYEAMKSLEQHHKDLMGLVEAWRRMSSLRDSPFSDDIASSIGGCADQLESLINPKD